MTARRILLAMGVLLVAAGGAWLLHRGTVEHANRRYHEGEIEEARDRYLQSAGDDAAASYNAGTAQLLLQPDSAAALLEAALATGDSALLRDAVYNLGIFHLSQIRVGLEMDSALALVQSAIDDNRRALRIDPRYEEARHNLALAQVMMDSLSQQFLEARNEEQPGKDETLIDQDALARSDGDGRSGIEPENPRPNDNQGNRLAASQGAREAYARQDPGPLSEATARSMLTRVDHNPEKLIRGLIWANRPEVEWWNSEPYPGGNQ